jgi:hypothetical protein
MIGNTKEEMKAILDYFKSRNIVVHVARTDNIFNNGTIFEYNMEAGLLVLKDLVSGYTPIPFTIIKRVEEYKEK